MRDRSSAAGPTVTSLTPVQNMVSRFAHHRSRSQEHIGTFTSYVQLSSGELDNGVCNGSSTSGGGVGGGPSGVPVGGSSADDTPGRASSSLGLAKVHSSNAIDASRCALHTPLSQLAMSSATAGTAFVPSATGGVAGQLGDAVRAKPAVRRAADARINKTKNTVTELQRAKHELEAQLSNLSRVADEKNAENASLRFEIKKLRDDYSDLYHEHQRQSVNSVNTTSDAASFTTASETTLNGSCHSVPAALMVDVATSPMHSRSQSFASSEDILGDGNAVAAVLDNWDRQSSCSEISLACLQDRIVQMEETHYSTTEELQATLAELTELQDIVDEMNSDIQAAAEQNRLLNETLAARNGKLDRQSLQIEHLKYLLLGSVNNLLHKGGQANSNDESHNEQRLLVLLKAAHDEQDEFKYRYVEAQQAVVTLREERQQLADMCNLLKHRLAAHSSSATEGSSSSAQSERVAELEAAILDGRLKQNALERESQSLQSTVKSQAEHVCTLEHQLSDLQHECSLLKDRQHSVDGTAPRDSSTADSTANSTDVQQLQAQIDELTARHQAERDEWAEFQADLQTAVVVANNFKMEAQEDIDRLNDENEHLRREKQALVEEVKSSRERLSAMSLATANITSSRGLLSPHTSTVRTRIDSYLKQATTPSPLRAGSSASGRVSAAAGGLAGGTSQPSTSPATTVRPSSASSVKALIESLEQAQNDAPDKLSLSTGNANNGRLNSVPVPCSHQSTGDVALGGVSTMSGGPTVLSSCSALKQLTGSEGDLLLHTPAPAAQPAAAANSAAEPPHSAKPACKLFDGAGGSGDAEATTSVVLPSASAAAGNGSGGTPKEPKGILVNRNHSPSMSLTQSVIASRKAAFLDADGVDPLAKLMKDAPRGLSRRNALLKWCQNRLCGYKNIDITNFSSSWNDGLALCALLHSYVPEQIAFDQLLPTNTRANFQLAFGVASAAGVPELLNVDEMVTLERPDWQQVMDYVKEIYRRFEKC